MLWFCYIKQKGMAWKAIDLNCKNRQRNDIIFMDKFHKKDLGNVNYELLMKMGDKDDKKIKYEVN